MPRASRSAKPGHERKDVRLERRQHGLAAVFGHHRVEPRELLVGNAAAVPEALDDVVFDAAEERNVLGEHRHVVGSGRPRQVRRVLGRQVIAERSSGSTSTTPEVTIAPSHSRT